MKKMLSIALCAAILISMASVPYSASEKPTASGSRNVQVVSTKSKTIKPVARVRQPKVPTDLDELMQYQQKNQVSETFFQSLQRFGAKTSAQLLSQNQENQTYSPVSLAYALGILGSGAKGETSKEIAKALESTNIKTVINSLNQFYLSNYHDEDGSALKIGNSLWMQEDYPIKSDFAKQAASEFFASSYSVDFSKQSTADAMARWISEQTGGLLNPSFQPDASQVLSIINTLYFQNAWADAFDAANNTKETFTLADGTQTDVTYLNQTFSGSTYYETEDYVLFELPFQNGQTMNFVLPKEGKELSSILTQKQLEQILSSRDANDAKYADVNLKLPKFSFDSKFNLNDTCKALGLDDLFTGRADLSGITDGHVALSNVSQESHIEVDENGCKAAAYTKMDLMKMSLPVEMEEYNLSLDRPFLFVITSADQAPLFVGTVYNPSK